MKAKILIVFLVLGLFMAVKPAASYAYWGRGHVWIGVGWPGPYYYGGGYPYYPYYDPYYYPTPAYQVVSSSSYAPVVVNGVTYYVNNGVYYTYTQYGYQAVATPVGAASTPMQAATATVVTASSDDSITVNIPNDKGGYSPVVLKKSGTGFVGPQGEYYSEFPKVSQLQTMYGK